MTLSAYFASPGEHQKLAWMSGSILEVLVDSAVSNGQVLITILGPPPKSARDNPIPHKTSHDH